MGEIPEVDFRTARVKRNRYARRIAAGGLVVHVGRGRPRQLLEFGGTAPRSVRLSDEIWALLEKRARAKRLTLHAHFGKPSLSGRVAEALVRSA